MKHTFHSCTEADCFTCNGGLGLCNVCGGAEGGLPKDCPGKQMTFEEQDAVYRGETNYINGE